MAAEVAAFLLKEKLQNLLNDETLLYGRLRRRINEAIECLDRLARTFRSRELSPEEDCTTPRVLTSIYLADDLVDMYHMRRAQQRRKGLARPLPLLGQRDLKRGIKKFLGEVKDVDLGHLPEETRELQGENGVSGNGQDGEAKFLRWQRISYLMDRESNTVGQEPDMKKLVADLICDGESLEFRVLPVVGPRCSGKTTMVKCVYNRADVKNHFDCCAWVSAPREFSFRDVVVSIMEQTTIVRPGGVDHADDKVLAEMLLKILMEKRYLIVLDDVFDIEAWYALTKPLPDSRNGSRVIITTRQTVVAELVDPWAAPLYLHRLSDKDRWKLLLKQAGDREGDLNEVRDGIMSKSWYSPLDAVLLGGILSVTAKTLLPSLVERLPSAPKDEGVLSDIVTLCFHELPPRLKVCFLYFSLFPRGFEVPVRRLLWLWLSEGFLNPSPGERRMKLEPEDLADICFEELCNRRLVEVTKWKSDGSPKTCRVLGFIHDHFSKSSMDSGLFHVHRGETSEKFFEFPQRFLIRRLVEYADIKSCSDHYVDQNLRTYLSFNTSVRGMANRDIGMFFKSLIHKRGFSLLKVLDLEGVYKPLLPKELGNLVLLRFLGLRSTVLDSIPSFVGDLPYLEALDLKHTNVTILPESIWKAKNLRHLYLNEVRIDEFLRKPTKGFLANLQTLRGLYVGDKKAITSGLDRLTKLRKLGLTCHENSLKAVCSWILQLPNLHSLKLRSIDEFGKPSKLEFESLEKLQKLSNLYLLGAIKKSVSLHGLFPSNVRKLTLSMFKLYEDPMKELGLLPQLRILRLLAHSFEGSKLTCAQGGFLQLRVLKLWMLGNLKDLEIEDTAMPLLQKLEIRRCERLKNISGLEHLHRLKDLILTNMPDKIVSTVSVGQGVHVRVNSWEFSH